MVRHHDELVEQIRRPAIVIERVDQEASPRFLAKQRTTSPGGGRNHVGLACVRGVLSHRSQDGTSAAKAAGPLSWLCRRGYKPRPFKASCYSRPSRPVISSTFKLRSQSCGHESLGATGRVSRIPFSPAAEYLTGISAGQKPTGLKTRRYCPGRRGSKLNRPVASVSVPPMSRKSLPSGTCNLTLTFGITAEFSSTTTPLNSSTFCGLRPGLGGHGPILCPLDSRLHVSSNSSGDRRFTLSTPPSSW